MSPSGALQVGAVVLAAGASRRAGKANKLLARLDGSPLIAHAVDAALASAARPVLVVVGHQARAVRQALGDRDVTFVENAEHTTGLSSSLRTGLHALPSGLSGALVCLGDMPRVTHTHLDALIAAFGAGGGRQVCVPYVQARRGNPVLWPARCFAAMCALTGDMGARRLLAAEAGRICRVSMDDRGVLIDVDTLASLALLQPARSAEG